MRSFKAAALILSPSWMSMAPRPFPSRLELNRPEGSGNAAPLASATQSPPPKPKPGLNGPVSSRLLSRRRRPFGRFGAELLGVLRDQPLPAGELHRLDAVDAPDGSSAEKAIQNIESNVPASSAPRDEAAIDVVPQRQARAAAKGFEFPPDIAVLKYVRSLGPRHSGFQRRGRSHPGELHSVSSRTQAPVGYKGSPLAQLRGVGKRLPDFFRRVAQFADKNDGPH